MSDVISNQKPLFFQVHFTMLQSSMRGPRLLQQYIHTFPAPFLRHSGKLGAVAGPPATTMWKLSTEVNLGRALSEGLTQAKTRASPPAAAAASSGPWYGVLSIRAADCAVQHANRDVFSAQTQTPGRGRERAQARAHARPEGHINDAPGEVQKPSLRQKRIRSEKVAGPTANVF